VAAGRAFGHREPDESVRNPDWLAGRLLGPAERELIAEHPISAAISADYREARRNAEVAGMSNLMLVRTRFIDEHLQDAMRAGAGQVVILGAGFDTRGYRFAELLQDRKVFEVDFHSTQEFKKRRLQEVLGSVPPHVVFVEIDFKREKVCDVLAAAGYREDQKTFFIWEGVSMYLTEDAVRSTLGTVGGAAPGSRLVMDFTTRSLVDVMTRNPKLPQVRYTSRWGEPWIFGIPDGREREFFGKFNLELGEVLSPFGRDGRERYLTRADGTTLGPSRRERRSQRSGKGAMSGVARLRMLVTMLPFLWNLLRGRRGYALAVLTVPERR
jgi:methyltransferase (TIGR00027 family)